MPCRGASSWSLGFGVEGLGFRGLEDCRVRGSAGFRGLGLKRDWIGLNFKGSRVRI